MAAAGCEAICDLTSHSAMLLGVWGVAGRAIKAWRRTTDEFCRHAYDAAVVIDSPMLNLPIALRARSRAIPVLYYIAPQLWAWGAWRMHKLRAWTDRLAVVLPFEERYFRDLGIEARYVGHPLFDALDQRVVHHEFVEQIRASGNPVLAILPGSRKHVVEEVLPGQLEVAAAVRRRFPGVHVGVSVARSELAGRIRELIDRSGVAAKAYHDQNGELLSAADLTLVASGTATLEVAHYRSPMIVMYNGSRLMYHLMGRWLVRTKYFSLINILAERELVPEFMPYYRSTTPIVCCAIELLSSPERRAQMRRETADLLSNVSAPGASARAADMLLEMIDRSAH
jgi:lipid-A-disaccharide synthase